MPQQNFFNDVYDIVKLIPKGRVTSYGAIAKYLGITSGARMVGWAMNAIHTNDIPAHRVVNKIGMLTGKQCFPVPGTMQHLLEKEGVLVLNDQVQHFDKVFWDPLQEL